MGLVDSISRPINYGITAVDHTVKKIVTNPSAVKKVLQTIGLIFTGVELYRGVEPQKRDITDATKGAIEILGVYTLYRYFIYWINPFSKENLDQKTLQKTIKIAMNRFHESADSPRLAILNKKKQENVALLFSKVMEKNALYFKGDVIAVLKEELKGIGYTPSEAGKIVERVTVQKKSRPIVQTIYMIFFTFVDSLTPLKTVMKWSRVDLSRIAASIGSTRIGAFALKLTAGPVLGAIASAALLLTVGESTYKLIIHALARSKATNKGKRVQAAQEMRSALLSLFTGVTDLALAALPLLFALNPPVILALSLIAKGTGLIVILVK